MPPSRATAIVTCSCGWRAGDSARASLHEDMEEAERALMVALTPRLIRHWSLGHHLTLQDRRFAGVVANAAVALREAQRLGLSPEPEDEDAP
jgi:hypothetical protein